MAYEVQSTKNLHVSSIIERFDSAIKNVLLCESANVNDLFDDDDRRIVSYNDELRAYMDWVDTRPKLDLPHTHPKVFEIDFVSLDVTRHIQNRNLRDLVRLYEAGIKELGESDSARLSSGIVEHDLVRFNKIMDQVDELLKFMRATDPLDKPESMPHAPGIVQGSQRSEPQHSV